MRNQKNRRNNKEEIKRERERYTTKQEKKNEKKGRKWWMRQVHKYERLSAHSTPTSAYPNVSAAASELTLGRGRDIKPRVSKGLSVYLPKLKKKKKKIKRKEKKNTAV